MRDLFLENHEEELSMLLEAFGRVIVPVVAQCSVDHGYMVVIEKDYPGHEALACVCVELNGVKFYLHLVELVEVQGVRKEEMN